MSDAYKFAAVAVSFSAECTQILEIKYLDLIQPTSLFLIIINDPYYMAGSASGQDEANPVL